MKLEPVDFDPFSDNQQPGGGTSAVLEPVDFDPFSGSSAGRSFEPVDFDPFAIPETSSPQSLPDIGRSDGTENILERGLRDTGVAVAKTVVGTGEALVGLSDLLVAPIHALSGGNVPLPSQGYREMGYNPEMTQQFLDSLYSKATLESKQRVSEADGFREKVVEAVKNPSTIVSSVGESVGPMLLGGGAARTMVAKAAMNPALAAALGEALITAGGGVSQITQANEDHGITGKQAAIATGSAALTGLISLASGGLQKRFGIDDIDVLVAGGRNAAAQSMRNPAVKLALSTFFEGAAEELPQSVQEQIFNNIAQDKPWDAGVDEAAAMGLLSGMAMGLGGGTGGMLLNRGKAAQDGAGAAKSAADGSQAGQPAVPVVDEIKAFLDQRAAKGTEAQGGKGAEVGSQESGVIGQTPQTEPVVDAARPVADAKSPEVATAQPVGEQAPVEQAPVEQNIYLRMPIERVQEDAANGVKLAAIRTEFRSLTAAAETDPSAAPGADASAARSPDGKMRGFSERLAGDENAPGSKEKILKSAGSYYQPQTIAELRENVRGRSDLELFEKTDRLGKDALKDGVDNDAVLSAIELINRKHARGEDVQGLIDKVSAAGTAMGQLIRQFAELKTKTPVALLSVIEKNMAKKNRFLRPQQRADLSDLISADFAARDAFNQASAELKANPSFEKQAEVARLEAAANTASENMMRYAARMMPQSGAKMFQQLVQGNLLVPISHARNIGSNIQMQLIRDSEQNIAAVGDALLSMIRNKPRDIGFASYMGRIEGAISGIKRGFAELKTGSAPESRVHGEFGVRGFHPLEAWKNVLNPARLPVNENGRVSWADYVKNVVEGTLGIPAEVNFRLLGLGDNPFRESTYRSVVREQAKLKGLTGKAKADFLSSPDAETVRLALEESLTSVYQDKNELAGEIQKLMSLPGRKAGYIGEWVEAAVIKPIAPYLQTPLSLAHIGLQLASPEYSAARAFWFADKARKSSDPTQKSNYRRKAYQAAARVVVGQTMMIAASAMVRAGLVSGAPDKEEKKRNLQYKTIPPNSINISGLRRLLAGEDPAWRPGDTTQNLYWYGFFGLNTVIVANQKAGAERNDKEWNDSTFLRTPPLAELASSMVEMTLLKGASDVLNAVSEGNYDRLEQQYFRSLISSVLPNTLSAAGRANQKYLPDFKGQERIAALKAIVLERNPFLNMNELYPFRYDPLGQPIERTPDGVHPWVYQVFDPAKTAKIDSNPVWAEIGKLYERTKDTAAIPSMPSRTLGKETLSPFQYERMMVFVGEERMKRINYLIGSESWSRRPDTQRVDLLEKAYREGSTIGRQRFQIEKDNIERKAKLTGAQKTYEELLEKVHGQPN